MRLGRGQKRQRRLEETEEIKAKDEYGGQLKRDNMDSRGRRGTNGSFKRSSVKRSASSGSQKVRHFVVAFNLSLTQEPNTASALRSGNYCVHCCHS